MRGCFISGLLRRNSHGKCSVQCTKNTHRTPLRTGRILACNISLEKSQTSILVGEETTATSIESRVASTKCLCCTDGASKCTASDWSCASKSETTTTCQLRNERLTTELCGNKVIKNTKQWLCKQRQIASQNSTTLIKTHRNTHKILYTSMSQSDSDNLLRSIVTASS